MRERFKAGRVRVPELFTAGASFAYYFIMALYRLTYTPIWQDEAMEFYCSIPVKGEIAGVTKLASMYERMAYIQQQPPLYNWLMCLWLMVDEGEWWYRFSSVIFGFIAAVGIYFIIRKMCDRYMAAFCVIIYSSIYVVMYYVKEASEYIMLVMLLIWLIYAFMLICERIGKRRLAIFTLLSVAAMYTHYSAAFVIIPMAACVLVIAFMRKDYAALKFGALSFSISGVLGGFPLIYFFLMPQMSKNSSALFSKSDIIIERGNIFGDFCFSITSVFKWCLIDIDRDTEKIGNLLNLLFIVLIAILIYVALKTEIFFIKAFLACNIAIFMIYYVVTKFNLYAYGWYGNRYNMFIFPLWFILIAVSAYEFARILSNSGNDIASYLSRFLRVCLVAGGILYCIYGDYRVSNHWWKMDLRTVVREWYERDGYNTPTILDFHQRYPFTYYFTHDKRYDESQWENIAYNDVLETHLYDDSETFQEYISKVYGGRLPDEVYLVTGQWNAFSRAFEDLGYTVDPIVDTNAKLYFFSKK